MQYRTLGSSDIKVSRIGLGTMTWGEQNSPEEAHRQLDMALDAGINFIDTAEMYPVPPRRETYGTTERIIGDWLRRQPRDRVVLATKAAGPGDWVSYIRGGPRHNREHLTAALDASLNRLQTDYVDLYQLHWPDRSTNFFGELGYRHEPEETPVPIEESLAVLGDFVRQGKVRQVGLSNETPWGVMRFLRAAETLGLPRVVSIQNPYNLLNRTFEIGLAEVAHREAVGLLVYSPLAFGMLTGKYLNGARPEGARLSRFERFRRYSGPVAETAAREYVQLARLFKLDPAQMALAYVQSRPFVTTTLIGATHPDQLRKNIESAELVLPETLLADIERVHRAHPNPCP